MQVVRWPASQIAAGACHWEQERVHGHAARFGQEGPPSGGDGAAPEPVASAAAPLSIACGPAVRRTGGRGYRWSAGRAGAAVAPECGASNVECRGSRRSGCMWERRGRLVLERPGRLRRARRHCFDATVPVIVTGSTAEVKRRAVMETGRESRRGIGAVTSDAGAGDKKERALSGKARSKTEGRRKEGGIAFQSPLLVIHTRATLHQEGFRVAEWTVASHLPWTARIARRSTGCISNYLPATEEGTDAARSNAIVGRREAVSKAQLPSRGYDTSSSCFEVSVPLRRTSGDSAVGGRRHMQRPHVGICAGKAKKEFNARSHRGIGRNLAESFILLTSMTNNSTWKQCCDQVQLWLPAHDTCIQSTGFSKRTAVGVLVGGPIRVRESRQARLRDTGTAEVQQPWRAGEKWIEETRWSWTKREMALRTSRIRVVAAHKSRKYATCKTGIN